MKNYLKEILKLRKNFSKSENQLIELAYKFAEQKHRGQKFDGQNYPYFLHPAYAGFLLTKWKRNYEEICAGLLHDVVEDCEVSLSTIRRMFGSRIAFLVDGMSWEIKWNKETQSWFKDRAGFYKKIVDYSLQDISVVIIHAADDMSKLSDIFGKQFDKKDEEFEKTKKRHMWTATIIIPFYKGVGLENVSENVWNKIKKYLVVLPKSDLKNYISDKNLNILKHKLSDIKYIEELKGGKKDGEKEN